MPSKKKLTIVEGKDLINFNPPEVKAAVFRLLWENNELPSPKFGTHKDINLNSEAEKSDDSDNDGNNNSEEEVDFFEFNPHDLEGNDDSFNKTSLIKKE